MSDMTYDEAAIEQPREEDTEYVSRRGRRMLTVLIVILILLLLLAAALLTQLLRGPVAPSADELNGVTWIRSIYGYGPDISQMIEPAAVAVDPEGGSLWVTDGIRSRVVKFNGSTGDFTQILTPGNVESSEDMLRYPSSIAVASDGWMYVAESTYDRVRVYDEDGNLRQTLDVPAPLSLAVNDDLLVVGADSGFAAYDRDGNLLGIIGTQGQGEDEFDKVNGVALDDENSAYIVDSFNNRIRKFDSDGFPVWTTQVGPPGNQGFGDRPDMGELDDLSDQYPAFMQIPMGATIDAAGRLIVVDMFDFSIAAFSREDGSFLGKWGTYGETDGKFVYPADIAYDPVYDWFVIADSGNNRAQIVRLPGSGGTAEAAMRRLLSGPLRACGFPLLILILMLIGWAIIRRRNRAREKGLTAAVDAGPDLEQD